MAIINYTNVKFEVGQEVALRFDGNKARNNRFGYRLDKVEKVGRKYITLESGIQIDLTTGYNKTKYSPDYNLFLSEELLLEQIEREKNLDKIRSKFSGWGDVNLNNSQLRRIVEIIKEDIK